MSRTEFDDILGKVMKQKNPAKIGVVAKQGYIYVYSAPMFSYYGENVYDVGFTKDLSKRWKQFRSDVPEGEFIHVRQVNSMKDETELHRLLSAYRLFHNHELFDVPLETIKQKLDTILLANNLSATVSEEETRHDRYILQLARDFERKTSNEKNEKQRS